MKCHVLVAGYYVFTHGQASTFSSIFPSILHTSFKFSVFFLFLKTVLLGIINGKTWMICCRGGTVQGLEGGVWSVVLLPF